MKKEDVRIGMKVVPFQKTYFGNEDLSKTWSGHVLEELGYLVVNRFIENGGVALSTSSSKNADGGDFFRPEDFEPYTEPKQTQKETQQMKKEEHAQLNKREKGRKVNELREKLNIKRMLRNGDTLIVWFEDGTEKGHKVVEKCVGKDEFDLNVGLALSYLHFISGSKSVFKEAIEKEAKAKMTTV